MEEEIDKICNSIYEGEDWNIMKDFLKEKYIPKAKITKTIKEYQKRRLELSSESFFADERYINNDTALVIGISVLQDLLKEE